MYDVLTYQFEFNSFGTALKLRRCLRALYNMQYAIRLLREYANRRICEYVSMRIGEYANRRIGE
jgi:hypothetical protein